MFKLGPSTGQIDGQELTGVHNKMSYIISSCFPHFHFFFHYIRTSNFFSKTETGKLYIYYQQTEDVLQAYEDKN